MRKSRCKAADIAMARKIVDFCRDLEEYANTIDKILFDDPTPLEASIYWMQCQGDLNLSNTYLPYLNMWAKEVLDRFHGVHEDE